MKLKPIRTLDLDGIGKDKTKGGRIFLYDPGGGGVKLNRVVSSIDAPVGSIVEVFYETASSNADNKRIKFPKILRLGLDK